MLLLSLNTAISWNIPEPVCNPLHWQRARHPDGGIQNIHASARKTFLWLGKYLPGSPCGLSVPKTNKQTYKQGNAIIISDGNCKLAARQVGCVCGGGGGGGALTRTTEDHWNPRGMSPDVHGLVLLSKGLRFKKSMLTSQTEHRILFTGSMYPVGSNLNYLTPFTMTNRKD